MKDKICGIYEILNTVNGKRYIGQSVDIYDRWRTHKSALNKGKHTNSHLQASWSLYGEKSFKFSILEECSREALQEREKFYISKYQSYKGKCGYNATIGGDGTSVFHEVLQFDAYGNFIKEYQNGIVASEQTGINVGTIYGCCIKKLKKADYFIFIYKEEYEKDPSCIDWWLESNRNSPVEQYDLYGNLVATWKSCSDIVRSLGINPISCLLHDTKSYHGYIWKRTNDSSVEINEEYCKEVRDGLDYLKPKMIYQYNAETMELIHVFKSMREAIRSGISRWIIEQCLSGNRKSYNGFVLRDSEIKGEMQLVC